MNSIKRQGLVFGIVLAVLLFTTPLWAVTYSFTDEQLSGASGIIVDGVSYDVEFVKADITDYFYDAETGTWDFGVVTSQDLATDLSQALLDCVFVDGAQGNFDSDPTLVYGITAGEVVRAYLL